MNHPRAATRVLPVLDMAAGCDVGEPPGPILQRWRDGGGRLVASGGRDEHGWWMHWPGLATYWFGADGPVRVRSRAAGVDERLADSFVRGVAPVVMLARGCEAFHGSAVADARGVFLFCAASGTGKSTLALALAAGGLKHWADDTVVYHLPAGHPVVIRLQCPVRVDHDAWRTLGPAAIEPDTAAERPLRRIYFLARDGSVDPSRPSFTSVPALGRFDRLLAHAHPFDMDGEPRRRRFVESLLAVAAAGDAWECRFAPSLEDLPGLARAVRAHMETE